MKVLQYLWILGIKIIFRNGYKPLFGLKHPSNNTSHIPGILRRIPNHTELPDPELDNLQLISSENDGTTNIQQPPVINENRNIPQPTTANDINQTSINQDTDEDEDESSDSQLIPDDGSVDDNLLDNEDIGDYHPFENVFRIADEYSSEVNDSSETNNTEESSEEEEIEIEENNTDEGPHRRRRRRIFDFDIFSSTGLTSARYNFNGTKCAVSYQNSEILLYDLKNMEYDGRIHSDYLQKYVGHTNIQTIKDMNFFGKHSEYVVSGSDTGHIIFWDTFTGEIVNILNGDPLGAVNCIQQHPSYYPVFISSGLSNTTSVWSPTKDNYPDLERLKDELN